MLTTTSSTDLQLNAELPQCILLTGYMGAGKSTVGRHLASALGYRFIDTDRELVKRFGKSISKVFEQDGEGAFRQAEEGLLKEFLTAEHGWVISTGGGTLASQERMELAQDIGVVVYLEADIDMLFERVIFSPKDRPMINVPNAEQVFKQRFKQREPFYTQANITVHSDERQPRAVVDNIVTALTKMTVISVSVGGTASQVESSPSDAQE